MSYNPECVDCSTVDPIAPVVPPVYDPPGGGLPAGGEPGQILVIDDDGNPSWAAGGGGGGSVTLYNTTGQSTTGGMTQKAITDELNGKATQASVTALQTEVNNKANQSAVDALTDAVVNKADKTEVTALQTALNGKADKTTVTELSNQMANKADKTEVAALQDAIDEKQDKLTAGDNITITKNTQTGETVISATGGSEGFVAEYGTTTAQDIVAYLESGSPMPMFIERNGVYYTVTTAQKVNDNSVIVRSFATLSGHYYMFQYTVTGSSWSASNTGFQELLTAGSNITIVKNAQGETVISATGDVSVDWSDIENKPADLVQDADYVHTDNNYTDADKTIVGGVTAALDGKVDKETGKGLSTNDYTTAEKDKLAGLENYDDTALTGRVTGLESDVSDLEADVADLETIVTAYEDRIAALEAKLADYEETRLQMSDGTNTVDKIVLTKPYVDPVPTMADLADGAYDAEGNYLGDFTYDFSGYGAATDDCTGLDNGEDGTQYGVVHIDRILAKYPTMKGMVLSGQSIGSDYYDAFENTTSGVLDWLVLNFRDIYDYLTVNGASDFVATIYTDETVGAPWGQTGATIKPTSEHVPWA